MTAVEWQFNELQKIEKAWAKEVIDGIEFVKMKYEILEKAKEMEKQEKIDFADKYGTYLLQGGIMSAVSYNETFKSE